MPTEDKIAVLEREIRSLKQLIGAYNEQITDLQRENAELRKTISMLISIWCVEHETV